MKQQVSTLSSESIVKAQQAFLAKVYTWMVAGLLLTAGTAWYANTSGLDLSIAASPIFYVLIIAQLGLVFGLSGAIMKLSKNSAIALFLAYSALTGLTFSVVLIAYTSETIYNTFLITVAMFASLSFYGFMTKKSLSGVGQFLFMGLVGLIVVILLNMFLASSALAFVINVIGVLIFAGLTAYDTQKLKEMYMVMEQGENVATKAAIFGALKLYLDFINMFLFLLRLVGGSRD